MTSRGTTLWFSAGIVLGEISIDGGLQVGVVPLYRAVLAAVQRPARFGEVTLLIGDPGVATRQLGFQIETAPAAGLAMTLDPPAPRSVRFG